MIEIGMGAAAERPVAREELDQPRDGVPDVERARVDEDGHDPEREADIADAVDDERLLGRERGAPLAVPEPDQQVAAQPHQLPGHEHDQPAVGQDQEQHREHEQVEVGEEAPVARIVGHVADAVDVHEHADRRDHDEQARGQGVHVEAGRHVERSGRNPLPQADAVALVAERGAVAEGRRRHDHRDEPRQHHHAHRQPVRLASEASADERRQGEARQRKGRDERDEDVEQAAVRRGDVGLRKDRARHELTDHAGRPRLMGGWVICASLIGASRRTRRRAGCGGCDRSR